MIIMSDVNGTPRSPNDPDDPDYEREPTTAVGRLWRAFLEWVDTYAWTIIILGVALILFDVLLVLLLLIYQISR